MHYVASADRYKTMDYKRCGRSGLRLPRIALGLWHNFGEADPLQNAREIVTRAFDLGVTHFDLANNYGPPPGSAEATFGKILAHELRSYRDELIISTKAGYDMWPGPYGDFGSRKYLLASLDQSLSRMGLDYVDIFYHHRPDPETPLEETMGALAHAVKSGKALYVGLSNYSAAQTREAARLLRELGTPCLIHQPRYNMLDRWIEPELVPELEASGIGCAVFSPLAQGRLSERYLSGIPDDSRVARSGVFLNRSDIDEALIRRLSRLRVVAERREQSLAQLALAWVLRLPAVTTALVGVSRPSQLVDCVGTLANLTLSSSDASEIEQILES